MRDRKQQPWRQGLLLLLLLLRFLPRLTLLLGIETGAPRAHRALQSGWVARSTVLAALALRVQGEDGRK